MNIRKLTQKEVVFKLVIEPEICCGPEDCFDFQEDIDGVYAQLEQGNDYAWCCVFVTASWNGITGHASLGCCSYSTEEKIINNLQVDLQIEALDALNAKIARYATLIEGLMVS